MEVIEIKPKVMLKNTTVQRKASAARSFLKEISKTTLLNINSSPKKIYLITINSIWIY